MRPSAFDGPVDRARTKMKTPLLAAVCLAAVIPSLPAFADDAGGKTGLFSEPVTADSAASGTTGDTAGEGDGVIRVFRPDVPQPVAIRYAWKSRGPAPVHNADVPQA